MKVRMEPNNFAIECTKLGTLWAGVWYGFSTLPWAQIVLALTGIYTLLQIVFLLRDKYNKWKKGEL